MKSERGFVYLLLSLEVIALIAVAAFCLAKQVKGPNENNDFVVIDTQNNVFQATETESETETETETEEPTMAFSEAVEAALANMTLEQKIAQLFIVSPEALTGADRVTIAGDGTKTAFETYPVGGVLYSYNNYMGRTQMRNLITGMQDISKEFIGQYPFVVTLVEIEEEKKLVVAWKDAENPMTELIRVEGNIRRASLAGLSLMSYIETEADLITVLGEDALRCVAIETNQLDAVEMIQEGADLLCITKDFTETYNAVLEAVQARTITETQIHDAAGRVLTQKMVLSEQE